MEKLPVEEETDRKPFLLACRQNLPPNHISHIPLVSLHAFTSSPVTSSPQSPRLPVETLLNTVLTKPVRRTVGVRNI